MRKQLHGIANRIRNASLKCLKKGRKPVELVAVSKTVELDAIRSALNAGVTALGESYIQEAKHKYKSLLKIKIQWHFIGHLQTNKARYAVKMFDLIHSVDSVKLAEEINKRARTENKIQKILVQMNMEHAIKRSGIRETDIFSFFKHLSKMENIRVMGLMTIPPLVDTPEKSRPYFSRLAALSNEISNFDLPGIRMEELSMGMSKDFEVAVEEGASIVRLGTAIFGNRL